MEHCRRTHDDHIARGLRAPAQLEKLVPRAGKSCGEISPLHEGHGNLRVIRNSLDEVLHSRRAQKRSVHHADQDMVGDSTGLRKRGQPGEYAVHDVAAIHRNDVDVEAWRGEFAGNNGCHPASAAGLAQNRDHA